MIVFYSFYCKYVCAFFCVPSLTFLLWFAEFFFCDLSVLFSLSQKFLTLNTSLLITLFITVKLPQFVTDKVNHFDDNSIGDNACPFMTKQCPNFFLFSKSHRLFCPNSIKSTKFQCVREIVRCSSRRLLRLCAVGLGTLSTQILVKDSPFLRLHDNLYVLFFCEIYNPPVHNLCLYNKLKGTKKAFETRLKIDENKLSERKPGFAVTRHRNVAAVKFSQPICVGVDEVRK